MEIMEMRDLIKDRLGNYYVPTSVYGKQLALVNAVIYYSFNRILNTDFTEEVATKYGKHVAVNQFFTDLVKDKIERIQNGNDKGSIILLEDLEAEGYKVKVNGLYERSVSE